MSEFRIKLAPLVSQICNRLGITHVLDYYCGNEPIMKHLKVNQKMRIQCYDPNIERFKESALAGELVFYSPEIEPELSVIDEVELLTGVVCVFAIQTEEADKWILPLIEKYELQTFQRIDGGFYAILYCKPNIKIEVPNGA